MLTDAWTFRLVGLCIWLLVLAFPVSLLLAVFSEQWQWLILSAVCILLLRAK